MEEGALSRCTGCGAGYALKDGEDYFCSNCHANMARLEHLTQTFMVIANEFVARGYDRVEVRDAVVQAGHLL
jgi:uncharacterized Zn ribbon protein